MKTYLGIIGFILAGTSLSAPSLAEDPAKHPLPSDAEQSLHAADLAYWQAFNACDAAAMGRSLSEDFEFYHDKGGFSRGRAAMIDATMKGVCGDASVHVRREPIPESIRYDLIPGYGGVLSGRHQFYLTEKGGKEHLTGTAAFAMVWRYDGEHWLLSRGLSLDHQAVENGR